MPQKPAIHLFSLVLLFAVSSRADLAFSVTPVAQSGVGSAEVFFAGTLTNTSVTDNLYLNNIQVVFMDAATNYLSADTNVFFSNVPGILLPGETYNDVLLGIWIQPGTPPGNYVGSASIPGGADIFAVTSAPGQTFEVSLPPAMMTLAVSGINFVLNWPSPPGGFVLQANSRLDSTNWVAVTNAAVVVNGTNQIVLTPSGASQFYRLDYP